MAVSFILNLLCVKVCVMYALSNLEVKICTLVYNTEIQRDTCQVCLTTYQLTLENLKSC